MPLKNNFKKILSAPLLTLSLIKRHILNFYKLYLIKDDFTVALSKWFRDDGDKNLRLKYPLTSDSIVFDLGGFKGDFAADIYNKFGSYVYVFEPVKKYYLECEAKFRGNEKVKCFNYGLSNESGSFLISDNNEGSSLFKINSSSSCERVLINSFTEELNNLNVINIDLLKINIEGPEFLILPEILSKKLISNINYLQIQFHTFYPNSKILRDEIRAKLSETHVEQWNYPFVWESWKRKE